MSCVPNKERRNQQPRVSEWPSTRTKAKSVEHRSIPWRLPPIHWKDQVKFGTPQIKQVGMGPFRFRPYPSIRGNFRSPGRVKADILATRS